MRDLEWEDPEQALRQLHRGLDDRVLRHPLVKSAIEEYASGMAPLTVVPFEPGTLPLHGLRKIAMYAAQVAQAIALGLDPDLLRLSGAECDGSASRAALRAPKPVEPTGWHPDLGDYA